MSPFTRLSAAAVSIIVVSAVLGFELGSAAVSQDDAAISVGPTVVSPGAGSQRNMKTRSVAGFENAFDGIRNVATSTYPAANPVGPLAGNVRVIAKRTRTVQPMCILAMN